MASEALMYKYKLEYIVQGSKYLATLLASNTLDQNVYLHTSDPKIE